jgi:CubicO group peptidase (beta-lactamase class C family)
VGKWASGIRDERTGRPIKPSSPFLSASVGKLFTAAALLSLEKEGRLSLEDPVTRWLDPALVAGLPLQGGDARLPEVTIRRLLSHTSGLPDYYEDKTADGTPAFIDLFIGQPERTWTTEQVIRHTKDHYAPAGAPGERFHYTDLNYDLAGLVAESVTGLPFHAVLSSRIFEPMGLAETWMHSRQAPPRKDLLPFADVWVAGTNVARFASISFEGAGGGLATTVEDLQLFMRSLVAGSPVSLDDLAASWTENAFGPGLDYGLGLWRVRPGGLFFLMRGYPNLLGASGSTGSYLYYVPDLDAVIAGTFDDSRWGRSKHIRFVLRVLAVLRSVEVDGPDGSALDIRRREREESPIAEGLPHA